jgi:hypothetical protein
MIARKPKGKSPAKVNVDRLIRKGGTSSRAGRGTTKAVPVLLKIPAGILETVDELVGRRKLRTYRSTWLLEAIVEKIEREE